MEQFLKLKEVKLPEQRSKEWYEMRSRMITASDFGTAIGWNKYEKPEGLIAKKVGKEKPFKGNLATQWGTKYEEVATMIYQELNSVKVHEFGCMPHPTINFLGASPDGITEEGIMLEIKCPMSREINGIIPMYYWVQMQGQLEVCNLEQCDFLECKLCEYKSLEDYLGDNCRFKGIVAEYTDGERPRFKYSSFRATELDTTSEWKFINLKYWKLEKMNCVPVMRNRKWFHEYALPRLAEIWNKILYYREHPDEWKINIGAEIVDVDDAADTMYSNKFIALDFS